jgi:serine/threonine protein phosphatase PrpC
MFFSKIYNQIIHSIVVSITKDKVYFANTGDSKAAFYKKLNFEPLS